MQKWEYMWVVIPNRLDQIKIQNQKVSVHDYLNNLGENGWEMVGIEQTDPGNTFSDYILFFKRSKS